MARPRPTHLTIGVAAGVLLVASVVGLVGGEGKGGSRGASPADGAVAIVDFAFEPAALTATVGETVTWTNEDGAAHTVTSDGDGPLDSGDLDQGAVYEASFEWPGTYTYICTIHPTMQGTVEVTDR